MSLDHVLLGAARSRDERYTACPASIVYKLSRLARGLSEMDLFLKLPNRASAMTRCLRPDILFLITDHGSRQLLPSISLAQ